jgi:CheY-like chemotaxis protein
MTRTLLLADDSVTIQRVIELTFADEDIKVIAVGDGQQAIARIDAERPDVVLADVGMPERDGYEVAAHVKGNPELAHIPVLLLTGAFEPIDEARAKQSGCDGVLVKPFEPQMVINRVKDLLAGRRPASLWSTAPGSTAGPTVVPPRAEEPAGDGDPMDRLAELPGASADARRTGVSSETLDDYFDRLDAAFSTDAIQPAGGLETPLVMPQAQPAADLGADFGSWDLPTGHAPVPDSGSPGAGAPDDERRSPSDAWRAGASEGDREADPMAPAAAPQGQTTAEPSASDGLADAFAALLTAERRIAALADQPADLELPDAVVDEIVRRVVARMSDEVVRATALEIAERLVREEIEKIKNQTP